MHLQASALTTRYTTTYNQASAVPGLACYWSSWHAAARDSDEMRAFLGMEREDCCLGFFMVAACDPATANSKRPWARCRPTCLRSFLVAAWTPATANSKRP